MRKEAVPWVGLAAFLTVLLTGCGGGNDDVRAGVTQEPAPDVVVSFDGTRCSSTIPG